MKSTGLMVLALLSVAACDRGHEVTAVAPDNSAVNVRDKNSDLPTPENQKENEADLAITQNIRQALTSDDSLSVNAKNIKIVTSEGAVTLRGPVKDVTEKDRVTTKARQVAGDAKVTDLLEIETN